MITRTGLEEIAYRMLEVSTLYGNAYCVGGYDGNGDAIILITDDITNLQEGWWVIA